MIVKFSKNKALIRLYKYYLTYIAAPVNRLRRCSPDAKTLFIAKFDGLGDFFLLLPFLKRLHDAGYRITVSGASFQKEILEHCGLAVASVPFAADSLFALRSTLAMVRKVRPEYAVNLSMSAWGGVLVNQTRAPEMVGLLQEREWYVYKGARLFYDRIVSYDPSLHGFEVNRRFFSAMLSLDSLAAVEHCIDVPAQGGEEVAVHPFGNIKWPLRRWSGFGELLSRLIRAGYRCAIIGTPAEHASSDLAARFEKAPGCRIVRLTSVTDLLVEIEGCRAFIGNDSGPAHYAALIGRPTFVLWGPANYERIRQVGRNVYIFKKEIPCRPCRQRGGSCPDGVNKCLQMIGAEEVMEKFRERVAPA
ncbi:MAG: glycosyltransferase family 9 protein [Chitinispirillaceae bacterium]